MRAGRGISCERGAGVESNGSSYIMVPCQRTGHSGDSVHRDGVGRDTNPAAPGDPASGATLGAPAASTRSAPQAGCPASGCGPFHGLIFARSWRGLLPPPPCRKPPAPSASSRWRGRRNAAQGGVLQQGRTHRSAPTAGNDSLGSTIHTDRRISAQGQTYVSAPAWTARGGANLPRAGSAQECNSCASRCEPWSRWCERSPVGNAKPRISGYGMFLHRGPLDDVPAGEEAAHVDVVGGVEDLDPDDSVVLP